MGGIIPLMVLTDSGYFYPGYVIYLSAIYTFYAILTAACMLHRSKRMENEVKPVEQIRK